MRAYLTAVYGRTSKVSISAHPVSLAANFDGNGAIGAQKPLDRGAIMPYKFRDSWLNKGGRAKTVCLKARRERLSYKEGTRWDFKAPASRI